jgi:2-oxoisovalerate dehydrogenase E1 component
MLTPEIQLKAYRHMCLVKSMAEIYEQNRAVCKYVHSTSRGHEAIQLATAFHLLPQDYVSPYYRDESLLLGLGFSPYTLMLQLLAKGDDPFSEGREYYAHPSFRGPGFPTIIHQSSATGMQAIPTTGIAQGLKFLQEHPLDNSISEVNNLPPVVICSLGDASITEGEVSEAFQFAVLKKLPIIFLIQDNGWGISVKAKEARSMDAYEFAAGFTGMNRVRVDGSDFETSYNGIGDVMSQVRQGSGPWIVQAKVPLLGHHTSGVRKEFYRDESELEKAAKDDPGIKLKQKLLELGISPQHLDLIEKRAAEDVRTDFNNAIDSPEPDPENISDHIFSDTPVKIETGNRNENGQGKVMMVDAALFAIREIMEDFPEAVMYGQDIGGRLGGVFREAATLATQFGDHRVFNTAIQEAYIIGSTAGMSAVGLKPIVEIQFADYIYPGINQLVTELSKSCYLSAGKFPVQVLIRVPVGAYGGGGPYHSGSIESTLLTIRGIKVVYPSNAADMKGLMKASFLDPNPVVMLEHKGLYWSKVPGTEEARRPEPSRDYIIPLGKALQVLKADPKKIATGRSCCIITYGMGVFWAKAAENFFPGQLEIVDLRTLFPLDEAMIYETVKRHGKCLVLTEDTQLNSFAESLAGRISQHCFRSLDAAVEVIGSLDLPAVPMNIKLEEAMLPNAIKINATLRKLLED